MQILFLTIFLSLTFLPENLERFLAPKDINQEVTLLRRAYRQFIGINDSIHQNDADAAAIHAGRFNRIITRLEKTFPERDYSELIDLSGKIMISRTLEEQYENFILLEQVFKPTLQEAGIEDDFPSHQY
ncbi:hypothetical protein RCC89_10325 [Cytophagaceae bacterium ABcell3]|nr:hypothetical protein RCC89_10325 [Cytophagaceae bacterium ABcell3]